MSMQHTSAFKGVNLWQKTTQTVRTVFSDDWLNSAWDRLRKNIESTEWFQSVITRSNVYKYMIVSDILSTQAVDIICVF